MQVELKIGDWSFRGTATWSTDSGLSAELSTLDDIDQRDLLSRLEEELPILLDGGKKSILIQPWLRRFGPIHLNTDKPTQTEIELRAQHVLYDISWDTQEPIRITEISVSTTALQIWRGDDNISVDIDRKARSATVELNNTQEEYDLQSGKFQVNRYLNIPLGATLGSFQTKSRTSANLLHDKPLSIRESIDLAYAIEGYFDLVTAFPYREIHVQLRDSESNNLYTAWLAIDQNEHTQKPSRSPAFIPFKSIGFCPLTFDRYLAKFSQLRLFQATVRSLWREQDIMPEGFLTACNVIESLSENAPRATSDLADVSDQISKILEGQHQELAKVFDKRMKTFFDQRASFKERIEFMQSELDELGLSRTIEAKSIRDIRGMHRHKIVSVGEEQMPAMIATIRLSAFYGLIWLCREIGIENNSLKKLTDNERFHTLRGTGMPIKMSVSHG